MKKVGDTMLKEWVDKAGAEGKQLVDAFKQVAAAAPCAALLDALYDGAAALAALFMVLLLVMVLLSILGRQLHFHVPGTDAYAGYMMAAAGFLALAHTLKRGEHIRVTLLLSRAAAASARHGAGDLGAVRGRAAGGAVGLLQRAAGRGSRTPSTTSPPATTPRRCGFRSWPWPWAR